MSPASNPGLPVTRRTEVFISAASRDLKSTREIAKNAIDAIGCHGVYQEEFPPDYRAVVAMLRDRISRCDAVIHIAGECYGSEPRSRDSGVPRRSYTQMEHDIAKELGIPLYVFVCAKSYPYDEHGPEAPELEEFQNQHRQECLDREEIREKVDTEAQLRLRLSQLEAHLKKLEKEIVSARDTVLEVGIDLKVGQQRHESKLGEIGSSVGELAEAEKTRGIRAVKFLAGFIGIAAIAALIVLAAADAYVGHGFYDISQLICLTIASLTFLFLVFKRRWIYSIAPLTGALASLFLGCMEPFKQESDYYLALPPPGSSLAWEKAYCTAAGKTITLITIQDPLRQRLAPWLVAKMKSPARNLPIRNIGNEWYAVMPLKDKLEGIFHDGVSKWRTLMIPFISPHLELSYSTSEIGFSGAMGVFSSNELVEFSEPQGDATVPWESVHLPFSSSARPAALLYACALNEALEMLLQGEKDASCELMFGMIEGVESSGGLLRPTSALERARVLTLKAVISEGLWRGSIGSFHSVTFLGPAYDAMKEHMAAKPAIQHDMVARWALKELRDKFDYPSNRERIDDLDSWGANKSLSNESWTMVANEPAVEALSKMASSMSAKAEGVVSELLRPREPRQRSYFQRLSDDWSNRSLEELGELVDSKTLSKSDKAFLADQLAGNLIAVSVLELKSEESRITRSRAYSALFERLIEQNPDLLPVKVLNFLRVLSQFTIDLLETRASRSDVLFHKMMAESPFASPFMSRLMANNASDARPVFEKEDLDFSGAWWETSYLQSFSNLLVIRPLASFDLESKEFLRSSAMQELIGKLRRADRDLRLLNGFTRDRDGQGEINLPAVVLWEGIAKGHAISSARNLDRVCKDVTRQMLGEKSTWSAFHIRSNNTSAQIYKRTEELEARTSHQFSFKGLEHLDENLLEKELRELLDSFNTANPGMEPTKDYLSDEIFSAVADRYMNIGYLDISLRVQVTDIKDGGYHCEIAMTRIGLKYLIGEILIDDNPTFPNDKILSTIPLKHGDTYSLEKLKSGLKLIREMHGEMGYYDYTIDFCIKRVNEQTVDIILESTRGYQTRISDITFDGHLPWGNSELLEMSDLKAGDLVNTKELDRWETEMNAYYGGNGYPGYKANRRIEPTSNKGYCRITIGFYRE